MHLFAERYQEVKALGSGMTGKVYLVYDSKTGRECALKVLNPSLGYVKQIEFENFQKEFEILKDLNHPSIAKVYDAGRTDETKRFFIVTEYIKGHDLFAATEEKPIEVIEDLFVQSLRAFNYLHRKKIYHLDVKPQNLLVTNGPNKPTVKVIDFGLANFYERRLAKPQDKDKHIIVGTIAYVSPEIVKGDPHDGRADLYSLGCTFYRAFTRENIFSGEIHEIQEKHVTELPKKPSLLNSNIPGYLDKILLKLLEKNPQDRYATAKDVIEDINISSGKNYEIETSETALSYIPDSGHLLCRKEEFERFTSFYDDRIYTSEFKKKPYVIVTGKRGCGKTRFLEECNNLAKTAFIQTLSWNEFMQLSPDNMPEKCLVLGDDIPVQAKELEYLEVFFEENQILAVLTTAQKEIPVSQENIIELKNFSREQTEEYLLKATGFSRISQEDLDKTYKITNGNPLYLTGVIKILFRKGKAIDRHGNWSQKIYEDLGLNLEEADIEEFIKKGLKDEIDKLQLDIGHSQTLNMLALAGKPTLNDLHSMSGNFSIDDALVRLVEEGILKVDAENLYVFANPLYKEIILDKMDPQEKVEYCDLIAGYYESQKAGSEIILHFRGRGSTPTAADSLLELARLQRKRSAYHLARENLELVCNKPNIETHLRDSALLELGEIHIEVGEYNQAEKYLVQLVESRQKDSKDILFLKGLEQLGVAYQRERNFDKSTQCFEEGLKTIKKHPEFKWLEVAYKNCLASNEIQLGNMEHAEKLFNEAWEIWKTKLNDEERILTIRTEIDNISYLKSDYKKAITYLEDCLKILLNRKELNAYPIILCRLGSIYIKSGQTEKGEELLKDSLNILKDRKMNYGLYRVYNELGNLYYTKKNYEEAIQHYKHAYALSERGAFEVYRYIVAFNIAKAYFTLDQFADSEKYFNFVLGLIDELKDKKDVNAGYHQFISLLYLADIFRQQNRIKEAFDALESSYALLQGADYLKSSEQLYWQRKAVLEKARSNNIGFDEAIQNLQALKKNSPHFNREAFERWNKSYNFKV